MNPLCRAADMLSIVKDIVLFKLYIFNAHTLIAFYDRGVSIACFEKNSQVFTRINSHFDIYSNSVITGSQSNQPLI